MHYRLLILLSLTLLLGACSNADTLGDEAPVEVVISGAPTYANGIGELLTLKCGYCHAYPLPDLAPDNIVQDLDLTTYATRLEGTLVIRGADAIGRYLHDGLLDHDINLYTDSRDFPAVPIDVRKMPLDYGTPLTDTEKHALDEWHDSGIPRDGTPTNQNGDADAGALIWGSCNYCHGLFGDGLTAEDGRLLGPKLEPEHVTIAKIKSMWLWSQAKFPDGAQPIADQDAADLRAYLFSLLSED